MPADRELQAKRRQAILEILAQEQVTEQKELVDRLLAKGIQATQSSISRDLKTLGAVRTRGYYEIPSWTEEEQEEPFRRVIPFVRAVRTVGPHQMIIVTATGAGRVVAQTIDESRWEDVVGIVDGDSSVLILTENFFFQRLLYERIKYLLSSSGESTVVELD